jgi:Bcr/CflA subfamily drug resistance transporter
MLHSGLERRVLYSTIVFAIAGFLGIDIHLASLPAIMEYMHTDKIHMQQSISLYLLGMGSSMLFYGPLSDHFGRRPVILFGLIFASIFGFLCMFTENIEQFLIARVFQGLGCGVCMGLGRTVIGDVLQGERFAIVGSRLSAWGSVVALGAPALGGHLQHLFGWQANFFAFGAYLLIAALIFGFFCPETHTHRSSFQISVLFSHYGEILTHRTFVLSVLLSGLVMSLGMIYAALGPFILQQKFHLSPVIYGWVMGAIAITTLVARFITSFMIRKLGRIQHLRIATIAFFMVSAAFLISNLLGILILSIFLIFSSLCLFARSTVATVFSSYALGAFPEKRGVSGSLYGSGQMFIAFILSGFVGLFSSDGIGVLVVSFFIIALLQLFIVQFYIQPLKK